MSEEGSEAPPTSGTGAENADEATPQSSPGSSTGAGPTGSSTAAEATGSSTGAGPTGSSTGAGLTGSSTNAQPTGSSSGAPAADPEVAETTESTAASTASATKSSAGSLGSKGPQRTSSAGSSGSKRKKGPATMESCRIGFLGAGKLAEAIVKGLVQQKAKIEPSRIVVSSKSGRTLDHFKQEGCVVTKRSYDLFAKLDCDVVFIAVHGFVIRELHNMGGTRPLALTTNYIPNQRHPLHLLSLVGGIPLEDIKKVLLDPENPKKYKHLEIHRIMLNTSVAYGLGLGALDIEPDSKKCSPIVRDLLTSFARIEFIPVDHIDAACALGGNGLAFVHYFISALSDGGFKMGLPKTTAVKLAAKTLQSSAAALLESGRHPSDLRDQCTSPSGPAIYGIHILEKQDAGSGMAAAVEGAFKRLRELVNTSVSK